MINSSRKCQSVDAISLLDVNVRSDQINRAFNTHAASCNTEHSHHRFKKKEIMEESFLCNNRHFVFPPW